MVKPVNDWRGRLHSKKEFVRAISRGMDTANAEWRHTSTDLTEQVAEIVANAMWDDPDCQQAIRDATGDIRNKRQLQYALREKKGPGAGGKRWLAYAISRMKRPSQLVEKAMKNEREGLGPLGELPLNKRNVLKRQIVEFKNRPGNW